MARTDRYLHDPVGFIDRFITQNEKGKLWALSWYQRRVLKLSLAFEDGRLLIRLLLWSERKKSGKTFLAAALALWWGFTRADSEIIIAANDLEQSRSRVFDTMTKLLKHNADLKRSTKTKATEIHVSNGTVIKAIPSDYRGEAGARHSLAVFDELWAFDRESAVRLFEELTPPPTEPDAWILIVTTAGFSGESLLLERLYQRGLSGDRLDDDLEVYAADDLVMFWSQTARQPWQTEAYYAEQARLLRPNTFRRLHRNEWTTAEATFITAELWDACVVSGLSPVLANPELSVFVGVDAALKHDTAAVVAVTWAGLKLRLVSHKIWKPTAANPLDLETTIEAEIKSLHERFSVRRVVCDPWQMARSVATLKAAGVLIEDFPQTVPNLTAMGQNLWDVLKGTNLELYADADLRQQALSTVALESARGWRVTKDRPAKKIDAIVALGMAALAATAAGPLHYRELTIIGAGQIRGESVDEIEAAASADFEERSKAGRDEIERQIRENGAYWPGGESRW